jgi:lactoylglutathione lyase
VRLDHVGLSVDDLDGMTAWWSTVLGARLEYTVDRPAVPMRAAVLVDPDGFRLELLHREGSGRGHDRWDVGTSLLTHGYGHVALGVDDVDATYARLLGHGAAAVLPPGQGSQPGMRFAFVADPEDNLLELVSRSGHEQIVEP